MTHADVLWVPIQVQDVELKIIRDGDGSLMFPMGAHTHANAALEFGEGSEQFTHSQEPLEEPDTAEML